MTTEEINAVMAGGFTHFIARVADDILAVSSRPGVFLDPGVWLHTVTTDRGPCEPATVCTVCAAGAFVLNRAKTPINPNIRYWSASSLSNLLQVPEDTEAETDTRVMSLLLAASRSLAENDVMAGYQHFRLACLGQSEEMKPDWPQLISQLGQEFTLCSRGNPAAFSKPGEHRFDFSRFSIAVEQYKKDVGFV